MRLSRLLGIAATLFIAACSGDIGNGSQYSGQFCYQERDCAPGLTCHDRICVPLFSPNDGDAGHEDDVEDDTNSMMCTTGARWCRDLHVAEVCTAAGTVEAQDCPDDAVCVDGACVPNGADCVDEDRDGYGTDCNLGPDCDDANPNVHPNRPEECGNGIDDNCDGRIDEGCMMMTGCCEAGCGSDEFCSNACECVAFNPAVCTAQDQPCQFEGESTNGFVCLNLSDEPRCWGICAVDAANPDATCPETGTVCAFPSDDNFGLCASPCGADRQCGAENMGCLPWDVGPSDGICLPATNRGLHDPCDENDTFSCGEGLICTVLGDNNGARCEQACRPFAHDGATTDCRADAYCMPVADVVGVCVETNDASEGEACGPYGTMCGEDTVACYDLGEGQVCARFCRLAEGNDDCGGTMCLPYDFMSTVIGYCR